ncbi:Energy-coupling factor transporter ATP-binding protein Ecf [Coccomyxa sp. Obi]|nr:Energy-coupling factor transporter ATP-binding protein Ecf [Coccomyxa sp. Obi]
MLRSTSGEMAIEVLDVSKNFGGKQVLSNASLAVPQGSFHMLLGPNGCGKSTLLRILGGLMHPDNGDCSLQQPVGFVFQNPDHQVVMPTVGADVAFGLGRFDLQERMVREHVQRMLQAVNLEGFIDRQTHTLSGGQKQRVAIAGALAQCPKVLLLDELTTFLDGEDQRGVLEAVRSCVGGPDQVTALWVTHRLEELDWADSVSYMDQGCIQFSGSPRDAASYLKRLGAHV